MHICGSLFWTFDKPVRGNFVPRLSVQNKSPKLLLIYRVGKIRKNFLTEDDDDDDGDDDDDDDDDNDDDNNNEDDHNNDDKDNHTEDHKDNHKVIFWNSFVYWC